jgi:uncharacterized protein YegL
MAKKLPVYLLLDTSGSMMGEPIEAVKNGVQVLVSALRQDPIALETAYLSIITFDSDAKQVVPLTDLQSFQIPELVSSGTTNLGGALSLLCDCKNREVAKSTPDRKGDWKPMVFIMSDGAADSGWESGLQKFKKEKWGVVVGVGLGDSFGSTLEQICGKENMVHVKDTDNSSIAKFFKWVSASISTTSTKVEANQGEVSAMSQLPPPPTDFQLT